MRRSKSLAREPNRRRRSADERSVASNASHFSSPPKAHGRVGAALDHVKATPESPGRPAVPGASAKVEAELAKLRKGWEAAEHRGIDLKVELLQTQVEARTLRASLHGSEVEARHALQAQEAMQAQIDELEARLPEMDARRSAAREAQVRVRDRVS